MYKLKNLSNVIVTQVRFGKPIGRELQLIEIEEHFHKALKANKKLNKQKIIDRLTGDEEILFEEIKTVETIEPISITEAPKEEVKEAPKTTPVVRPVVKRSPPRRK